MRQWLAFKASLDSSTISAMTQAPARSRWFHFGLRGLLVGVTALAVSDAWVAYNLNWIRQRHDALSRASHLAGPTRATGLLWLFGEQGYTEIDVVFTTKDTAAEGALLESKRIADLFPEAEAISVYGDRNTW